MKWHQNTMVDIDNAWTTYMDNLEKSLETVAKEIDDAKSVQDRCTGEWCTAIEHVLDEIANALFTIHEPATAKEADTKRLKALKRRVHDIYAQYSKVAA